jgi:hydrogenase maturation protein HypF
MKRDRIRITIRGAVQGVGFRPFIYHLATELSLGGWIVNCAQGVLIEAEGLPEVLEHFCLRLQKEKPAHAIIQSLASTNLPPIDEKHFEIRESDQGGGKTALILPDLATCAECVSEVLDPTDRRYRYPFNNCTHCGPRFSIIEALPYDRVHTSMKKFTMCTDCEREYRDPANRRFHAEPIACPRCGPRLQLWDSLGKTVAADDAALHRAAGQIRAGKILALKGLGGFQLLVDARAHGAIARLRARKHRAEKPFGVMFPSLEALRSQCRVDDLEERLLLSSESPIVLMQKLASPVPLLDGAVAPNNPNLGVMLPYTPLHHLLLRDLGFPVVATSGNLSDEPICIDESEALERLGGIADFYLIHDRPIVRHVDDSIVRVVHGREMILRRARGFAPLPIALRQAQPNVLALGAHLKSTVALSVKRNIFVSQHIGDLSTQPAYDAFARAVADLPALYDVKPDLVAHDLHPEYLSTRFAVQLAAPKVAVQHHWAHVAACMAENDLEPPLLGVAWDGTGYGYDGTIWGGEFFLVKEACWQRFAHFRTFLLPGGDAAVKEPRRSALGLLYEIFGEELWDQPELLTAFSASEQKTLRRMLTKRINAPITSSAGRLFDGVAALAGLRDRSSFEGQAAMELEFAIDPMVEESYPFSLGEDVPCLVDWAPALRALLVDRRNQLPVGRIAARFHHMLGDAIVAVARRAGEKQVALSGGCFQNRYLTERVIDQLRANEFQPYWHQRIPPNDGGIAPGQIYLAEKIHARTLTNAL